MTRASYPVCAVLLMLFAAAATAQENGVGTFRTGRTFVRYAGISDQNAEAIGRTAEDARYLAVEKFGLDMPDSFRVSVAISDHISIANDGNDTIAIALVSERNLLKPNVSTLSCIYDICRNTSQLAMRRLIPKSVWMRPAAAEAWAQYIAARMVDDIYAAEGPSLWPDAYDYRADGTARIKENLKAKKDDDTVKAIQMWMALRDIVGDRGFTPIFREWGRLKIDPAKPSAELRRLFLANASGDGLVEWWDAAEPLLVQTFPKAKTGTFATLSGQSTVLSHDDGQPTGLRRLDASAHDVGFEVDSDDWYLTDVVIYGARIEGDLPAPKTLNIWLCDENLQEIAHFKPTAIGIKIGSPGWVKIKVPATRVPRAFLVCVSFNPVSKAGGEVSYDGEESGGYSYTGLPGGRREPFADGDWMIRAVVERAKQPAADGAGGETKGEGAQ